MPRKRQSREDDLDTDGSTLVPRKIRNPCRTVRVATTGDHVTERSMVMDAALRVMARTGYVDLSVNDVLAEAGLSTRSFYRHFDSKEALLQAAHAREVDSVVRSVQRAVDDAPDPVAAIEAWLEAVLDTFFEPKRAARGRLFAPAALEGFPLYQQLDDAYRRISAPLAKAVRAGVEAGVVVSSHPRVDALTVFTLVGTSAHRLRRDLRSRAAVRAHVVRFAWPALGLADAATSSS